MTPDTFRRFYGLLPEPMLLAARDGRVLAGNPAAATLIRRAPAEVASCSLAELTADPPEKVAHLLLRFARSGDWVPGALEFRDGDERIHCRVEGRAVHVEPPPALLLRLQSRETASTHFRALNEQILRLHRAIAGHQRTEAELHAQREWLRTTLASIGDGVIATDQEARIAFMNSVAEQLTGWDSATAAGRQLEEVFRIVNEVSREPVPSPVAEVQRRGVIVGLTNRTLLIARDGAERAIADSGAPIFDAAGRMVGVVMVFRDVTERRRNELQMQETNRSLQRSNENLRQFAYAVAHDLKEPMRLVSLYSQLLAKECGQRLGEEGERYLRQTVGGANRMEELLEGLLAFIAAGEATQAQLEDVDLGEIVANALGNLDSMVRNTGARVTWEALPVVRGHAAPLLSIFQNLIGNAVKYHADAREPVVSIRAARREREWLLTVEDNGIGIEPEYHQRIFGVFKRLHPAKYPGTGIGLALCSRLLEGRGGTIWVESEPGRGSRFCLTIPDR